MITTDDLRFFLSLASTRSLAQAARALDVTPPAVTQRLNALEKRLGVRLVNRSGRGTALTDEGRLLAQRATQISNEINDLADELAGRRGMVAGHLRVVAPLGFGQRHIAGLVAQFRQRRHHGQPDAVRRSASAVQRRLGRDGAHRRVARLHAGGLSAGAEPPHPLRLARLSGASRRAGCRRTCASMIASRCARTTRT